ncbi:MAG: hypothetical protein HQL56_03880 [Magnetococcales bacterium]|nr:hypothetical protein [Magnetococcales bacterium]
MMPQPDRIGVDGKRDGLFSFHLVLACLLINLPLLLNGASAPLFRHDFADQYLHKFGACAAFLGDPAGHAWYADILRGWPMLYGSIFPLQWPCLFNTFLNAVTSMQLLVLLHEVVAVLGAYWFLRRILAVPPSLALLGGLLYGSQVLYYVENYFVVQTSFLPAIFALVSVPFTRKSTPWLLLGYLGTYLFYYPPYILPNTLLFHGLFLLLIQMLFQCNLKGQWLRGMVYWGGYGLFAAPAVLGIVRDWSGSNRLLWSVAPGELPGWSAALQSFLGKIPYFLGMEGFLYPSLVLAVALVLAGERDDRVRRRVLALGGVGLFLGLLESLVNSELWLPLMNQLPWVGIFSFIYSRFYYAVPFVWLLLWGVLLSRPAWLASVSFRSLRHRMALLMVLALPLVYSGRREALPVVASFCAMLLLLGGVLLFLRLEKQGSALQLLLPVLLVLTGFKGGLFLFQAFGDPSAPSGLAEADRFAYPVSSPQDPRRMLSVVEKCAPREFYPAQVSQRGWQTLDGFSVFYAGAMGQQWLDVVVRDVPGCSRGFQAWNNRVELTEAAWQAHADDIVAWARFNHVGLIRSRVVLDHPELVLLGEGSITEHKYRRHLFGLLRGQDNRREAYQESFGFFVYELKPVLSRVMAVSAEVKGLLGQGRHVEAWQASGNEAVRTVPLTGYLPARLDFDFAGREGESLLVVDNHHPDWRLLVDGQPAAERLSRGPMGVLSISAAEGSHHYRLHFAPWTKWLLPASVSLSMLWILGLPWLLSRWRFTRVWGLHP